MELGETYKILGKNRFVRGVMDNVPEETKHNLPVQQIFQVHKKYGVAPGDLVVHPAYPDEAYLLISFGPKVSTARFYAMLCDQKLSHVAMVASIHPVTGMQGDPVAQAPVDIWCVEEIRPDVHTMKMTTNVTYYYTNAPVKSGDKLDGREVRAVREIRGVNMVEVLG